MSNEWWMHDDAAWWIKTRQAKLHVESLDQDIKEFVQQRPYRVVAEAGSSPRETIYRIRVLQPIPARFSARVGDALHNLRSALDCAAFELAHRYVGKNLTEEEERACQFPIAETSGELDRFFKDKRRSHLFGPRERRSIAAVQPGWRYDRAASFDIEMRRPRTEDVQNSELWILNRLSNIDKHRRLHLTVWWPDIVYWTSEIELGARWIYGQPPFDDGAVLGRLILKEGSAEVPTSMYHELDLRLTDPPTVRDQDIVSLLNSIVDHVSGWVLPHVLNPYWLDANGEVIASS